MAVTLPRPELPQEFRYRTALFLLVSAFPSARGPFGGTISSDILNNWDIETQCKYLPESSATDELDTYSVHAAPPDRNWMAPRHWGRRPPQLRPGSLDQLDIPTRPREQAQDTYSQLITFSGVYSAQVSLDHSELPELRLITAGHLHKPRRTPSLASSITNSHIQIPS